jgi:RNA polymerase sigma-70 factor (ECF subfamily)
METTLAGRTSNAAAAAIKARTAERRSQPAAPTTRSSPLSEFAELYDQYFPKVFAYVYGRVQHKEASLDIVSDVFEKAFVKKQSLRSAEAFGSWLFTIARNEVASHWRKEKPAAKAMQDAAWHNELNNKPPSPEDTLLHRERVHHLVGLLRQLPPREQEIISLKFDAELTNREIAEILHTSEVNVRVTIFRALRKLRDRMEQQQEVH